MPGKVKDAGGKKAAQQLDGSHKLPRHLYETELFRLQGELVKMQEWVRAEGARIVVIFEGRDAAGKGGTIKRVTEYLNPRARPDRRAARPDRAAAHPVVLPALRRAPARRGRAGPVRPQLVQPGRRGARHGVLHQGGVQPVPAPVPDLRAAARRGRHPAAQVLVLGQRRGAAAPVRVPAARPDARLEALAHGPGVDHPVGGLLPGQGRDVRAHRHPRGAVARGGERRQAARPHQHDRPPAQHDPLPPGAAADR